MTAYNRIMGLMKQDKLRKIMIPVIALLSIAVVLTIVMFMIKPAATTTMVNPELSVEYTDVDLGDTIPLAVKATGGNGTECFTLTFSGEGAGLSEEYVFEDEKITVTDKSNNDITINREIGGDGAVNYWFNLENGQQTEFILNCTSGVFVTTVFDEEEYLQRVVVDDEIADEDEIEQMKQADLQAKIEELDSATLNVIGGCGTDLDSAKLNTVSNEALVLNWNQPEDNSISLFTSGKNEVIETGSLTDTLTYTLTEDYFTGNYTLTISGTGAMPDYDTNSRFTTPWYPYRSKMKTVIIEDGVTTIGACSFYGCGSITSLSIGKDVAEIKSNAIRQNGLNKLHLPSNVKTVGTFAFADNTITNLTIDEGVEYIGPGNFNRVTQANIHLPSTITYYYSDLYSPFCSSYTVAEGNTTYFAEDGVLYSYLDDGTAKLIEYPRNKTDEEFTVPSFVSALNKYCFSWNSYIRKITVSSTVTTKITISYVFYSLPALEELTFEEGVTANQSYMIDSCPSLKTVNFSDNFITGGMLSYQKCYLLEYIYVPPGTTGIPSQTLANNTRSLNTVHFNAKNCTSFQNESSRINKYDLTIGEEVNYLRGTESGSGVNNKYGFQSVLKNAQSVKFVGENQITISAGVFDDMPEPLNSLVGTIWVDAQGVVYKYDASTLTASVAYVPFDVTEVTIPETITPEDSVICTVDSVDQYAFKLAENVTTVNFENPSAIEEIGSYGMAYCSKLSSVNGETAVEEVQAIFSNENVAIGYRPFYSTALTSLTGENIGVDDSDGLKTLTVSKPDHEPLYISVYDQDETFWNSDGEIGKYQVLTGTSVSVNMSVGNSEIDQDSVYRVYFELSELDAITSISPGETITMSGTEMTCYATDAPNIVYVEFTPSVGTTVNTAIDITYPSPTSAGGDLKVWGYILTLEESAEYAGKIVEYETVENSDKTTSYINALNVQWSTQEDDFKITKSSSGNAIINIAGDGSGGLKPSANLAYTVTYERTSAETSAYGKDYVESVDFYDYVDFGGEDSGISWNSAVVEEIKKGNVRYSSGNFYAGDVLIAKVSVSGAILVNGSVEYDEEKGVVLHWKVYNTSTTAEIATNTSTFTIYPAAVSLDSSLLEDAANTKYIFTNTADAVTHYAYSEDKTATSSVDKSFNLVSGNITMMKGVSVSSSYFGSDIAYTISLYNTGSIPYRGGTGEIFNLTDVMSVYSYITPENMELMFDDEYGESLSITINNAVIYPNEAVTSQDGQTAYITGSNSDVDAAKEKLVISWNSDENAIQVLREDGTVIIVEDSLQSTLDSIGYSVGGSTSFTPKWILNDADTPFVVNGGHTIYFGIYANYKDTFMMLTVDNLEKYSTSGNVSVKNNVYLYKNGNTKVSGTSRVTYMQREAYVYKRGWLNSTGDALSEDFRVKNNDVIDYQISFYHYGTGEYENLPLVDDICGGHILLVPVDQNSQLEQYGLETVTAYENGEEVLFYKLSKSGTYNDVVVGLNENNEYMTAESITVRGVSEDTEITINGETHTYSGVQTTVKWYYDELEGENYYTDVNYHTFISSEQYLSSVISAGNIAWMNDKTNDRIFTASWGSISYIEGAKSIVTQNEDGSYTENPDGHTTIEGGESVTYCLKLYNTVGGKYTLSGTDFYDALPVTGDVFEWEKDVNVTLTWEEAEGVTVTNLDNWYIDDNLYDVYQDGARYIKWDEDTTIEFEPDSELKMYVTLDYPKNTNESGKWSEYCLAMSGADIENSFVVFKASYTVTHSLKEPTTAVLQKGVYATYRRKSSVYTETPRRIYYNNQDCTDRAVSYYLVLYNDSNTKLYLNDIYDELPDGFSYASLLNTATFSKITVNSITTPTTNPFTEMTDADGETVTYVSAGVSATQSDGVITFKVSGGTGTNAIKYDSKTEKYYLDRNEAIVFGYVCTIGTTANTKDNAINTVGMEFYDYLDAGVKSATSEEVAVNGNITDLYYEQNDGTRSVKYGSDISSIYSFAENALDDSQWLISDVTISRGGIVPGITKYTDSYVNSGTTVENEYKTSVSPFATINWRSRLHNSGTSSITDYTFIDALPAPYSLTDKVAINIYDSGATSAVASYTIFTVTDRNDEYITIKSGNGTIYKIYLDGTANSIVVSGSISATVSVTHDSSGKETLKIIFSDKVFSIPENGGYVDITLSGNNVTGFYENTVYTNFSYLIPNTQPYDNVAQGSLVYGEDGAIVGAMNNSPVNVSTGYSTSSLKKVEEVEESENFTTSDEQKKYIVLNNETSEFKYTLTVTNDTNFGMSKLILIDNLPHEGDHSPFNKEASRNSEFKVSLAEDPEFSVMVYTEDGNSYVLSSDYYTIGYSASTEFTSDDWDGTEVWDTWTAEAENVRSLRLYISDSAGEQIPPRAKVEFSFNAVVDDTKVTPGTTAWNSFGYHYKLTGVPYELEAMPLSVGVKVPEAPVLQKKLVDLQGNTCVAKEDTIFRYLIYSGDILETSYNTVEELKSKLTEEGRSFTEVDITVKKGESVSEKLKLKIENWEWITGESYTITEIIENDDYAFGNWNNNAVNSLTFSYDPDTSVALNCTNIWQKWSFEILKTDGADSTLQLSDATFAIYSPNSSDMMTDEEYSLLEIKADKTYTDSSGAVWYLCGVATTDENGLCGFENLNRVNYYLVEVKSPDGYKLDFEPRLISNTLMSTQISIKNYTMTLLPNTGGIADIASTVGKAIFVISLIVLVFIFVRRRHIISTK